MKCLRCNGFVIPDLIGVKSYCTRCNGTGEVDFYTEQEIKAMCTTDIIKKMVKLAEGFELRRGAILYLKSIGAIHYFDDDIFNYEFFSLLIYRAVEGFNKNNEPSGTFGIYTDREKVTSCNFKLPKNEEKDYKFKNYQPENLTQLECALLHCLIEIFKSEVVR